LQPSMNLHMATYEGSYMPVKLIGCANRAKAILLGRRKLSLGV
jgi:hypothetical protein